MRSYDMRVALAAVGEVHTLIICGASRFRLEREWDGDRTRRASYDRSDISMAALRQRLRIRRWVRGVLNERRYEIVVARYLGLALYVPCRDWKRLVVDADDLYKSTPRNPQATRWSWRILRFRNLLATRLAIPARHVWFVSPMDSKRLRTRQKSWLPNVIRLPDPQRSRASPIPGRILMVGYFEYSPNALGLRWFARHILQPLTQRFPEVRLHAIGRVPSDLKNELQDVVRFEGYVDDLATAYDHASLVIAPIFAGGGTQIKVIDALAHQRPLVISAFCHEPFAAELRSEEHLLVASSAEEWVEHCSWILRHPGDADRIAAAGCNVVRSRFGTDRMAADIRTTLTNIAPAMPSPRRS